MVFDWSGEEIVWWTDVSQEKHNKVVFTYREERIRSQIDLIFSRQRGYRFAKKTPILFFNS